MDANSTQISLLCALVSLSALAVAPLPAEKRIPVTSVATLEADKPTLHMPTDVAVDSTGVVYVADGARDRIVTFSKDFKVHSATTQPAGQKLTRPVGLTVDAKDNLWIADTANHRVVIITAKGTLVSNERLPATESGKPSGPTDIALTPDGRTACAIDNLNHRLLFRDNETGQWTAMGKPGSAIGQFQYPFMVAIGNDDDVLITEAIGSRIQIVTKERRWAGAVGAWGVELGQFHRPKGIATDSTGRIFVSDSTLNVIQVFDPRGRVAGVLTDADGRPIYFRHPMGMAFDRQGRLYVVELAANRVAVVSLKEGP